MTARPCDCRDAARPGFFPSWGSRDVVDRYLARHGRPPADWPLRIRAAMRVLDADAIGRKAHLTRRERREMRAHLGPEPVMVRAVRLIRRSRTRAMWAVALRAVVAPREVRRGR